MTHSKDRSASTGSGFKAALRRVVRTVVLLLVLLLVATIGLVIGTGSPEAEPSAAELALSEGSDAAQILAETAAFLEDTAAPAGPDYAALARTLRLHSIALRPVGTATGTSPPAFPAAASSPPASPSASPAAPTPTDLLVGLTDSYTHAFEAAAVVDAGPARVLASAATAQWLQSRVLAESLGKELPPIPVAEVAYDDGGTSNCPPETTLKADIGLDGARTAVLAEQRAAYAYEVVAARSPDPVDLLEQMAQHEGAAAVGSAILARYCVAEPLPAAAYALDESFLSDPAAALQELEESLAGLYADLVGVSAPGPAREWAMRQLAATAQHLSSSGGSDSGSSAFPGIDPGEYPRLRDAGS
ncbi:hypothetical protein GCM10027404_14360 [Arthrobacter tumbae]|uniref:DUF4439 domain-containing protein n=1 Tax=Arthrobacter tumbae TaxID=163874 RepID=UPI001959341D|nr:DUF4439 domain-containing protein [Arthrobacter tumbae]MBM7782719.1 hypothetical protein [Arthrobacter tumbae]